MRGSVAVGHLDDEVNLAASEASAARFAKAKASHMYTYTY